MKNERLKIDRGIAAELDPSRVVDEQLRFAIANRRLIEVHIMESSVSRSLTNMGSEGTRRR
jgi:hypothetical protein